MAVAGPTGVGTPPDPTRFPHWREYAAALADFYAQQARVGQGVQPTAVQLVHVNTATGAVKDRPRATQDGILAFDPSLGAPVVSIGGSWIELGGDGSGGGTHTPTVIRPEDYTGTTEARLTAAITDGIATGLPVRLDGVYSISSALPIFNITTQHLRIEGSGKIVCTADLGLALHFYATYPTAVAVSAVVKTTYAFPGVATVIDNATRITAASGHGVAIGDLFKIVSDDLLAIRADPNPRCGETVYAADVVGNDIYVAGSLLNTYTTNIRLARTRREAGFVWDGPEFAATPAQSGWDIEFLRIRGFVFPYVRAGFEDGYDIGVSTSSCYMADLHVTGRNMRNRIASEGVSGYLVNDSASAYTTAEIDGVDARHAYTTDSPNPTLNDSVYLYGQTYGAKVTGTFTATSGAAFDTHTEAYDVTFHDIVTGGGRLGEDAAGSGAGFRGTRTRVVNGIDRGSTNGLQFYAQVAGGCTDCSAVNWNYDGNGDGLRFGDAGSFTVVRPTSRGGRIRTTKNRSVALWDTVGAIIEDQIIVPSGSASGTTAYALANDVQLILRRPVIDLADFSGTNFRLVSFSSTGNSLILEAPRVINAGGKLQTWVNAGGFSGSVIIIDPDPETVPFAGAVINGGSLTHLQLLASMKPQSFPVASLPSAVAEGAGTLAWTTDGNTGVACLAVSDGTTWRRLPHGATVSAT